MKIDILTFCDNAQEYNNKLVIVGTFNSIAAPQFPAIHKELAIAIRVIWDSNDIGDHHISISIKKESEDVYLVNPTEIGVFTIKGLEGDGIHVNNIIVRLNNLYLPSEGKYVASLLLNDKEYTSNLILQNHKP